MWEMILAVGLQVAQLVLGKNLNDKAMMERFFQFVERIQNLYLKSAHLQQDAKDRWAKLEAAVKQNGFQETP